MIHGDSRSPKRVDQPRRAKPWRSLRRGKRRAALVKASAAWSRMMEGISQRKP
jgi:hypothetical protein